MVLRCEKSAIEGDLGGKGRRLRKKRGFLAIRAWVFVGFCALAQDVGASSGELKPSESDPEVSQDDSQPHAISKKTIEEDKRSDTAGEKHAEEGAAGKTNSEKPHARTRTDEASRSQHKSRRKSQRKSRRNKRRREKARAARDALKARKSLIGPRPPAPRQAPPLPAIIDHKSALERQMLAQWGWRSDKDRQVRVPLPDWKSWQRIRLWNIDHLTAFRYTKAHHAVTTVFAVEMEDMQPTSFGCMAEFERKGFVLLDRHHVKIGPVTSLTRPWRGNEISVHQTDGRAPFLLSQYEFSAAWAAYPAYDNGCLIYATVVLWEGEPQLARTLRDRWVQQAVRRVNPLTETVPYRH